MGIFQKMFNGGVTRGSVFNGSVFNNQRFYGVSWDEYNDSYVRTGELIGQLTSQTLSNALLPIQAALKRCVINDAGVVQYYLDPDQSTKKPDGSASDLTGIDGQVMVEIPAFYYKYGYSGTTHTWEISLYPLSGFSLHPAFIKNGSNVTHRYIGAYEGSLYDVSASRYTNGLQLPAVSMDFDNATSTITCSSLSHPFSLLESGDKIVIGGTTNNNGTYTVSENTDQTITTVEPLLDETGADTTLETKKDFSVDILSSVSGKAGINHGTRVNFRGAAARRGTGWRQQDYDLISAVQLLYLIEYADFNSQAMIGAGLTNFGGSNWSNWSNYNPIEKTGNSNLIGNATFSLDNGANKSGSYMSYRGIENFFGHIWKWVDGININNNVPYVSNNDVDFDDNIATNYTDLGVTLANTNGYQVTLEQQARGFLPASVGGASNTYITDYYYQNSGWRVMVLGGYAYYGGDAGAFCASLANSSGGANQNISAQLSLF